MANIYDGGDLVRCSGVFKNSAGTAIDPTTVKFSFYWQSASSTITTYVFGTDAELVKDSTGNYHVDIDSTGKTQDTLFYRFFSEGSGQGSGEKFFQVRKSGF